MSADALGWQEEHVLDDRRRRRNGLLVSLAIHGLVFATFAISPPRLAPPLPAVLSVDLVTVAPSGRTAPPRSAPKSATPKAEPKPAPAEPPPPSPPPIAKAPVQVLPENAPRKIKKVEAPQKVARKPEPKPEPRPRRPKRKKELSYEDAMAALDDEMGLDDGPELLEPVSDAELEASAGTAEPRAGVRVSAEMGAWITATTRRIQNNWKGLATYQGRGLVTALEIELSASGKVLGTPRVVVSSGDPYFDDNAVRAVQTVDPLPAPPRAGVTMFNFRSEEY